MTGPTPGDRPRWSATSALDGSTDRSDNDGVLADPRVADAISRVEELADLPLDAQVDVFSDIHRRLAAVLADPDSQA